MTTKRCRKCGETKPVDEFYRDRRKKDGMQFNCKDCAEALIRDSWSRRLRPTPSRHHHEHQLSPMLTADTCYSPPEERERSMKILPRTRRKAEAPTAESVILTGLRQAHAMHPARMMPSAIISLLNAAGFVIMTESDLDSEIAFAFQAGEERGRDR